MQCERCRTDIGQGDERELNGQILCEDCYMDLLSPAKACDPWAVYTAKSLAKNLAREPILTPVQRNILDVLEKEGPLEPEQLSERLNLNPADLQREIATLRHMEKIRGELRDGIRVIRLWD